MAAFWNIVKKKGYEDDDDDDIVLQREKSTIVPEDLLIDVLSRLPPKSVARFRCVSKSWCDLIVKDKYFRYVNLNRITSKSSSMIIVSPIFNKKPTRLCTIDYNTKDIKEFSVPINEAAIRVVSSINGVLFLRYALKEVTKAAIWNPLSEKYWEIFCPVLHSCRYKLKPIIKFGFGYEKTTKDYKVVALVNCYQENPNIVEPGHYHALIYGLTSNSWKRLESFSYELTFRVKRDRNPVFCSGAIHWIVEVEEEKEAPFLKIIRFNLVDEKFDLVPLPISTNCPSLRLSVLDDRVCVTRRATNEGGLQLWVMNKNGIKDSSSWTMMIDYVDDHFNLQTYIKGSFTLRPLAYLVKSQVVVFIIQKSFDEDIIFFYDLVHHYIDIIHVTTKSEKQRVVAFPYTETLECL